MLRCATGDRRRQSHSTHTKGTRRVPNGASFCGRGRILHLLCLLRSLTRVRHSQVVVLAIDVSAECVSVRVYCSHVAAAETIVIESMETHPHHIRTRACTMQWSTGDLADLADQPIERERERELSARCPWMRMDVRVASTKQRQCSCAPRPLSAGAISTLCKTQVASAPLLLLSVKRRRCHHRLMRIQVQCEWCVVWCVVWQQADSN